MPATTLDDANEKSIEFIEKLTVDLISCFDSEKIHMGLDEPFEMRKGKNCKSDAAKLFVDYVNKLNFICKNHNKKMMIWSDALHRFNCFNRDLPKDVTYLEWGYEKEYPFDERCKKLYDNKLDFYVCLGTSSWMSFTGMTDNMIQNINNAVQSGIKFGAKGVLLTDWGDCNHMQPLPVSYPGIVFCGALSWNSKIMLNKNNLAEALNIFIYEDENKIMGNLTLDAGNYYKFEETQLPCRTLAHLFYSEEIKNRKGYVESLTFISFLIKVLSLPQISSVYLPALPKTSKKNISKVLQLTKELKKKLKNENMKCKDAEIIKQEFYCAMCTTELFTKCRESLNNCSSPYKLKDEAINIAE